MNNTDKKLETIQRLLALAEHPSTPAAEAETALHRAELLMVRHGIERAAVDARGDKPREEIVEEVITFFGPYFQATHSSYQAIGAYGTCFLMQTSGKFYDLAKAKTSLGKRIWIVGTRSEVAKMITLARSLETQSLVAMNRWWKSEGRHSVPHGTGWDNFIAKREFVFGFMSAAASRVLEIIRTEAPSGSSSELVLVGARERAEASAKDNHGRLGRARGSRMSESGTGARGSGYAAGRGANINQNSLADVVRIDR